MRANTLVVPNLPFDDCEPTPSELRAVSDAARTELASRMRTDPEFWVRVVLKDIADKPGTAHAAGLLYPRAMQALRSITAGARIGAYQTTEEKALGLFLCSVEHMAAGTAAESAALYLNDGDSHATAVRKAVAWVAGE